MIVAASTTPLAESRRGTWRDVALDAAGVGSAGRLAANLAVAEPTAAGRVIAAWPSFALIGAYELLMRQVRRRAGKQKPQPRKPELRAPCPEFEVTIGQRSPASHSGPGWTGMHQTARLMRVRIFSRRSGTGPWRTGGVTARCPAGVRSPVSLAGTSGRGV
jgi:hypothetical protein